MWLQGENVKDGAFLLKTEERNVQILGQVSLFFEPICHITGPHFKEWSMMIKKIKSLKKWHDSPYFSILLIQIGKTEALSSTIQTTKTQDILSLQLLIIGIESVLVFLVSSEKCYSKWKDFPSHQKVYSFKHKRFSSLLDILDPGSLCKIAVPCFIKQQTQKIMRYGFLNCVFNHI